jgi:hypothetical protein
LVNCYSIWQCAQGVGVEVIGPASSPQGAESAARETFSVLQHHIG